MKIALRRIGLAACLGSGCLLFTGCGTTDGDSAHVSGSVYYGVGFYDPWYHGAYWYDTPDVIVTPPPAQRPPDRPSQPPARPTQPIYRPPAPRPMPSIPSMPRVGRR